MREAFEQALKQDRYDVTTRLIYADWLEEQGLDNEATEQRRMARPEWSEAARRIEEFASAVYFNATNEGPAFPEFTFDELIQAGHDYINKGLYFPLYNSDPFWEVWSIVTGTTYYFEEPDTRPCCGYDDYEIDYGGGCAC